MTVSEVRKRYFDFFTKREHALIPSAPIVPENDATTLFTSSGMQPLVPYLLGQEHPEGTRLVDAQTCFRAEDIEEVGDNRHTTFFEMLGNWSLGDYFKKEQLSWLFEFLTKELGLPVEKLWVTCFEGDEALGLPRDTEAADIWKELGVAEDHITFYPAIKNWWSRSGTPEKMPAGELGGTDSEIFFDFGTKHDPAFGETCHPNCDCGRFIEIGNSVFMEYLKQEDGSFGPLPKKNVDFGGGLERQTAATHNNPDIFLIDVFDDARAVLEKRSQKKYGEDAATTRSFRIILDHMRAASFMLANAIHPGNSEQSYILRRLIRRAIREADKLGIKDAVLVEVADGFGEAYADAYPIVKANHDFIRDELAKEEAQFRKTLEKGTRILDKYLSSLKGGSAANAEEKVLPAGKVFELYTTYGFPVELTLEMAKEQGFSIGKDSVDELMQKHQENSRTGAAQKFAGGLADHADQTIRYHTAHHLLLKALQMVLGPEVHQRGSNITSERLRIDFNWNAKMTDEQKADVERIVNEQIDAALPVTRTVMAKEEAEKLGAEHEFGATYPEQVSVYSVGPKDATQDNPKFSEAFSIEFCGGPHVANTSELAEEGKHFHIKKEEASSAGVRRIKAVLK